MFIFPLVFLSFFCVVNILTLTLSVLLSTYVAMMLPPNDPFSFNGSFLCVPLPWTDLSIPSFRTHEPNMHLQCIYCTLHRAHSHLMSNDIHDGDNSFQTFRAILHACVSCVYIYCKWFIHKWLDVAGASHHLCSILRLCVFSLRSIQHFFFLWLMNCRLLIQVRERTMRNILRATKTYATETNNRQYKYLYRHLMLFIITNVYLLDAVLWTQNLWDFFFQRAVCGPAFMLARCVWLMCENTESFLVVGWLSFSALLSTVLQLFDVIVVVVFFFLPMFNILLIFLFQRFE